MARELVLVPKAKYAEFLSKHENEGEKINENNGNGVDNNGEDGDRFNVDNNEKAGDKSNHNDLTVNGKSDTEVSNDQKTTTKRPLRRSIGKKSQRGGKLYIKKAPVYFLKAGSRNETRRKWLSFKL